MGGGWSQSRKGAIEAPERHPLPNCKQALLLTKSSWHSGWFTSAGRVAARDQLARRETHGTPEKHARCTPRKPGYWDQGGDKTHHPPGGDCARQAPGHLSCSDLGRAKNTGPTESTPLESTREREPEQLRSGKFTQPRTALNNS